MGRRRRPYDPNRRNGHNSHNRRNGRANGHGRHDRRSFYRSAELAHAQIVAVEIPAPCGTPSDATARLEPGLHGDGAQAEGELKWRAPEAPRLVVVCRLRGDQIARMEARRQISQAQFASGRHYQSLHEIAFARALHSLDLAAPVIDKGRYGIEPFSDRQRDAIHRLRFIDGSIVLRHGIDVLVLVLVHAVRSAAARWSTRRAGCPRPRRPMAHGIPPGARRDRGVHRSRDRQAGARFGPGTLCLAGGGNGRDGAESALTAAAQAIAAAARPAHNPDDALAALIQ